MDSRMLNGWHYAYAVSVGAVNAAMSTQTAGATISAVDDDLKLDAVIASISIADFRVGAIRVGIVLKSGHLSFTDDTKICPVDGMVAYCNVPMTEFLPNGTSGDGQVVLDFRSAAAGQGVNATETRLVDRHGYINASEQDPDELGTTIVDLIVDGLRAHPQTERLILARILRTSGGSQWFHPDTIKAAAKINKRGRGYIVVMAMKAGSKPPSQEVDNDFLPGQTDALLVVDKELFLRDVLIPAFNKGYGIKNPVVVPFPVTNPAAIKAHFKVPMVQWTGKFYDLGNNHNLENLGLIWADTFAMNFTLPLGLAGSIKMNTGFGIGYDKSTGKIVGRQTHYTKGLSGSNILASLIGKVTGVIDGPAFAHFFPKLDLKNFVDFRQQVVQWPNMPTLKLKKVQLEDGFNPYFEYKA